MRQANQWQEKYSGKNNTWHVMEVIQRDVDNSWFWWYFHRSTVVKNCWSHCRSLKRSEISSLNWHSSMCTPINNISKSSFPTDYDTVKARINYIPMEKREQKWPSLNIRNQFPWKWINFYAGLWDFSFFTLFSSWSSKNLINHARINL